MIIVVIELSYFIVTDQENKQTNKTKQETKIKLNFFTTSLALVKNFVNFEITNFLFLQPCSHLWKFFTLNQKC